MQEKVLLDDIIIKLNENFPEVNIEIIKELIDLNKDIQSLIQSLIKKKKEFLQNENVFDKSNEQNTKNEKNNIVSPVIVILPLKKDSNIENNVSNDSTEYEKKNNIIIPNNMNTKPSIVVLFRKGLRIHDHTALLEAHKLLNKMNKDKVGRSVMCLFNFDPVQVGKSNEYRSERCIKYMIESLKDLDQYLRGLGSKLYFTYGEAKESIEKVLNEVPTIEAVYGHQDVTPFSIARDKQIADLCGNRKVEFKLFWDDFLIEPGNLNPDQLGRFSTFKPFYEKGKHQPQKLTDYSLDFKSYMLCYPEKYEFEWGKAKSFKGIYEYLEIDLNLKNLYEGGRKITVAKLKDPEFLTNVKTYGETRMNPGIRSTELSAALKFGVISIREAYNMSSSGQYDKRPDNFVDNSLVRELYFREFYSHVTFHFPNMLKGKCFVPSWDKQETEFKQEYWDAWCSGMTGVPFVDAGMRQLLATGYMHNKLRVQTSSFLNKQLNISWKLGEKFFAQNLFDYDPSLNNGGWQSSCGFGASPQNWEGVMNPWGQAQKFDPDCVYIKRWVPQLQSVDPKAILKWDKVYSYYKDIDYPKPIVDHIKSKNEYISRTFKLLGKK